MNKLLVIAGPTATGKTTLALKLAEEFDGELVSADSRQVYKKMDIGTGKDVPENFNFRASKLQIKSTKIGFYSNDEVRIWGYDLVEPNKNFNVSEYIQIARAIIKDIWARGKLPILVGGTGLYIKGVLSGIETAYIPGSAGLRKKLEGRNPQQLYEMLEKLDPIKAKSMNNSDRYNPRRLVRAIELSMYPGKSGKADPLYADILKIGLKLPKPEIKKSIEKRVEKRIKLGLTEEINVLLASGVTWHDQSMDALGYRQWKGYFSNKKDKMDVVSDWINAEYRYAKRQMTWFEKETDIHWFAAEDPNLSKKVKFKVKKWLAEASVEMIS